MAELEDPWVMTFLPDGKALGTEEGGILQLVDPADGAKTKVGGTPTDLGKVLRLNLDGTPAANNPRRRSLGSFCRDLELWSAQPAGYRLRSGRQPVVF